LSRYTGQAVSNAPKDRRGIALSPSTSSASFRPSIPVSHFLLALRSEGAGPVHCRFFRYVGFAGPGAVQLDNPLQFWVTDGIPGIKRRPLFNVATAGANNVLTLTEAQTIALGNQFADFRDMEGNPHGFAHTSFGGSISSVPTAVKDPLFFLLHANVDRLWAKCSATTERSPPGLASRATVTIK
jgi:hypothetical protein